MTNKRNSKNAKLKSKKQERISNSTHGTVDEEFLRKRKSRHTIQESAQAHAAAQALEALIMQINTDEHLEDLQNAEELLVPLTTRRGVEKKSKKRRR
jgi:hypothetical protein